MQICCNRIMRAAIDLLSASAIVTLLLTAQGFGQCNIVANGCAKSKPVPCSNAVCADIADYPGGDIQICDNGQRATLYSGTSAPGWYNCQTVNPPQGAKCTDAEAPCLNVWFFESMPCNQANKCASDTYDQCGYSTGPGPGCT